MGDSLRRRAIGPVIDHPAMQNYEFLMALNNAIGGPFRHTAFLMEIIISGRNSVQSAPRNQFLAHQPQLTLDPLERDPLERGITTVDAQPPASQPYVDYFANTSLSEPEAPPDAQHHICRAQLAARHYHTANWLPNSEDELDIMLANEYNERERVRALENKLDTLFDARKEFQTKLASFNAQLFAALQAWSTKDPTAYTRFVEHLLNAEKCSTSKTRVWHIATWFKGSAVVPDEIFDLVEEVANCYTNITILTHEFESVEIDLGNEDMIRWDDMNELMNDDEGWVFGHDDFIPGRREDPEILYFGEDFAHLDVPNGFSDYAPKGSGAKMAEHVIANLNARQVRLTYADKQEVAAVKEAVLTFARRAEQVTSDEKVKLHVLEHTNPNFEADIKAVSKAHQIIVDYRAQMTKKRKRDSDDTKPASSWDKEH